MNEMLEKLCSIIIENLNEEFAIKHLSLNLVKTIKIQRLNNEIQIHIPAQVYDIWEYKRNKVIKYTGKGSYASSIDKKSENHKDYINRIIDNSIQEWLALSGYSSKAKVEG